VKRELPSRGSARSEVPRGGCCALVFLSLGAATLAGSPVLATPPPAEPPTPDPPGAERSKTSPEVPAAAYACREDGDCQNSCALGAVSRSWYRESGFARRDCRDGCAGPGTGSPVCIGGRCVAMDRRGHVRLGCTEKARSDPKDVCRLHSTLFAALLARAANTCKRDQDCGTYPAGIAEDCGGVTGEKTAFELRAIGEAFVARRCDFVIDCAPREAPVPACSRGHCAER